MLLKSLANSIEVEVGRDDVIVVEQEDELSLRGVDRCIATDADSNIVTIEVDHSAVPGRFRILDRKPQLGPTIIDDDDLGLFKVLA